MAQPTATNSAKRSLDMEPPSSVTPVGWAWKASFEAHRLPLFERQDAGVAEDEESEFRAVIWATTCHLKYAQYSPTNNNRRNNPRVTLSERVLVGGGAGGAVVHTT